MASLSTSSFATLLGVSDVVQTEFGIFDANTWKDWSWRFKSTGCLDDIPTFTKPSHFHFPTTRRTNNVDLSRFLGSYIWIKNKHRDWIFKIEDEECERNNEAKLKESRFEEALTEVGERFARRCKEDRTRVRGGLHEPAKNSEPSEARKTKNPEVPNRTEVRGENDIDVEKKQVNTTNTTTLSCPGKQSSTSPPPPSSSPPSPLPSSPQQPPSPPSPSVSEFSSEPTTSAFASLLRSKKARGRKRDKEEANDEEEEEESAEENDPPPRPAKRQKTKNSNLEEKGDEAKGEEKTYHFKLQQRRCRRSAKIHAKWPSRIDYSFFATNFEDARLKMTEIIPHFFWQVPLRLERLEAPLFPIFPFQVLAQKTYNQGDIICAYAGKVRVDYELKNNPSFEPFLLEFKRIPPSMVFSVDATFSGNESRFIRNALNEEDANVHFIRMGQFPQVFATRTIQPGEELLSFYGDDFMERLKDYNVPTAELVESPEVVDSEKDELAMNSEKKSQSNNNIFQPPSPHWPSNIVYQPVLDWSGIPKDLKNRVLRKSVSLSLQKIHKPGHPLHQTLALFTRKPIHQSANIIRMTGDIIVRSIPEGGEFSNPSGLVFLKFEHSDKDGNTMIFRFELDQRSTANETAFIHDFRGILEEPNISIQLAEGYLQVFAISEIESGQPLLADLSSFDGS